MVKKSHKFKTKKFWILRLKSKFWQKKKIQKRKEILRLKSERFLSFSGPNHLGYKNNFPNFIQWIHEAPPSLSPSPSPFRSSQGPGGRSPVPALAPPPLRPLLDGVLFSSDGTSFLLPDGPGVRAPPGELRLGVLAPPGVPLRRLFPSTRLSEEDKWSNFNHRTLFSADAVTESNLHIEPCFWGKFIHFYAFGPFNHMKT